MSRNVSSLQKPPGMLSLTKHCVVHLELQRQRDAPLCFDSTDTLVHTRLYISALSLLRLGSLSVFWLTHKQWRFLRTHYDSFSSHPSLLIHLLGPFTLLTGYRAQISKYRERKHTVPESDWISLGGTTVSSFIFSSHESEKGT